MPLVWRAWSHCFRPGQMPVQQDICSQQASSPTSLLFGHIVHIMHRTQARLPPIPRHNSSTSISPSPWALPELISEARQGTALILATITLDRTISLGQARLVTIPISMGAESRSTSTASHHHTWNVDGSNCYQLAEEHHTRTIKMIGKGKSSEHLLNGHCLTRAWLTRAIIVTLLRFLSFPSGSSFSGTGDSTPHEPAPQGNHTEQSSMTDRV
jgi:hypothetical protein